jgi:hypothetical protein
MSMTITLTFSDAATHRPVRSILTVRPECETDALLHAASRLRALEQDELPGQTIVGIGLLLNDIPLDGRANPYTWRDIQVRDDASAVIAFFEVRAALIGPHDCLCGNLIRFKPEFDTYGDYGYQWATSVCPRCKRDHVAFAEAADHVFAKEKRRELEDFYSSDRFPVIAWRHRIVPRGSQFHLCTSAAPSAGK